MYDLDDLATMTGLTTRTLRNYIKRGILHGEKCGGSWRFSADDFAALLSNGDVKRSLRARRNGDVLDFLAETPKRSNQACFILDCAVSDTDGAAIASFFTSRVVSPGVRFSYERDSGMSRVILHGEERLVAELIAEYYQFQKGGSGK